MSALWTVALVAALAAAPGPDETRRADVYRDVVRLVGLAPGAVVWDTFAVGAEIHSPGVEIEGEACFRLELSDGTTILPVREPRVPDHVLRATFEVDANQLAPGPLDVVAVLERPDGPPLRSAPVSVVVAHPAPEAVFAGEFEDYVDAPRPEGFRSEPPRVGSRADASGGEYVANTSARPIWVFPFTAPATGRYQMMVVARGDAAAGAFPSIGFCLDGPRESRTATRLVDRSWHRLALGYPVELEAGEHDVAVLFLNDFHLPGAADRNLYLDRFELLRVEDEGDEPGHGAMGMMASASSMGGAGAGDIQIGLSRALDGLPVNGRLQLEGICRWSGMTEGPAPWIELVVNGRTVAGQQATRPLFALDRGALQAGDNTVQLRASLPDGRRGATPVETVTVGGGAPQPSAPPRDLHRFSVVDEGWDEVLRGMLTGTGEEEGHRVAALLEPETFRLALPEHLDGEFDVVLQARGPGAPRAAVLDVSLETGADEQHVGQGRVQNWWNIAPVGQVSLARGPKTLAFVLGDGSIEPAVGNDTPLLRSVLLRERRDAPDRRAPRANVLYPPLDHVAHGVDAVVVEAWDDEDRLSSADLWIDGEPQRSYGRVPDGAGWLVLPMILRDLEPGPHVLSVRVQDAAGNEGETLEIPFVVAAEEPAALGPYARAVRLLSRFAHGPEPQQLAAVLIEGEREWLARRLGARGAGDLSAEAYARAQMRDYYEYAVTRAAIQHSIGTRNPVWARFTWWAENHFSTWIRKSQGGPEWREHQTFLRLGPTSFRELLMASATSPAMLHYLDQRRSYSGQLNENYAREILELHTVGVDGGYDQRDVTELASLLAGLTLVDQTPASGAGGVLMRTFRFAPRLSDGRERTVLGTTFPAADPRQRWERFERLIDLLATHASTARFVSRKLAAHYVAAPPPEALVDDLAQVFLATDGDLTAVLLALAEHEVFQGPDLAPRVMSPIDYGFRLARLSGNPALHWAVHGYLQRAGMAYFDRPTPDGYPEEDAAWTDTNATMQRWSLPRDVPWAMNDLLANGLRSGTAGDVELWRRRVIDVAAVVLTGDLLGDSSMDAAMTFFDTLEGNPWGQVNEVAALVAQMPEGSLK
jgi:hypothetical protein